MFLGIEPAFPEVSPQNGTLFERVHGYVTAKSSCNASQEQSFHPHGRNGSILYHTAPPEPMIRRPSISVYGIYQKSNHLSQKSVLSAAEIRGTLL
jgi:hypothetical protein